MKNNNFESSIERMKELIKCGEQDAKLKPNISETVEYKVSGPDGNTYGIVKERQKYFIKESKDGIDFGYIGGIGNRSENEYPSYNSAYRNLELKIREMNTSNNTGKIFETFKPAVQAEYIIEATQDMRNELDRFRQITNGAQNIMEESGTEFINKPKFKDTESFGTATDPKKQGDPFTDNVTAKLEKDPGFKATDPKKQGSPFTNNATAKEDKFDIEKTNDTPENAGDPFTVDAKDVLGNSVATQKPKAHKVIKVTESQLYEARKILAKSVLKEDFGDEYGDELRIPDGITFDDDDEETYDSTGYDDNYSEELAFPIPSNVRYMGNNDKLIRTYGDTFEYVGQTTEGLSYIVGVNKNTGREVEIEVPTDDLERIRMSESVNEIDDEMMDEGLWDTVKAVGSVGKYFGGQATGAVKQGAQNAYGVAKQGVQAAGQKAQAVGQKASQLYNQSQAQSSQAVIDKIADKLKNELINLNTRTVKSGGQPLNYNSVLTGLSNKLRGQLKNTVTTESVDEDLVSEITEAVLNAFGQHPTYQKPAFTTSSADSSLKPGTREWDDESVKGQAPNGQKIASSAPFTNPVKQKAGEGEIGEDAGCDVMKGKTQQGKPNLGQKGDKAPFTKPVKKSEVLNKLAESIIADLKKK